MSKNKKEEKVEIRFTLPVILDILTRYSLVHDAVIKDSNKSDSKFYGLVDLNKSTIYLQRDISTKMKIEALIHELIHIIKHENGISDNEKETCENEREIYRLIFGEEPRMHE